MIKKRFFAAALSLLIPAQGWAAVTGSVTAGGQLVNAVPNSSKFNEYRDLKDGPYLYDFRVTTEGADGLLFEVAGKNAGYDDQSYRIWAGQAGTYSVELEWDQLNHLLSNRARTPFIYQGDGLFTAPGQVGLTAAGKNQAPSAAQMALNDPLIPAYLRTYLRPTELGNDRRKFTATANLRPADALKFRLSASNEDRSGNKVSYGPIGDRPPRSYNIQLPEPIDYRTREVKFETDYLGKSSQANFTYELSNFWNNVDAVTWRNIYADDGAGTFEAWQAREVATYGRRALPQDNLFQNFSLTYGVDLPWASRLSASASYGIAEQDNQLLPYSTNGMVEPGPGTAWNDPAKLPRQTSKAKHESKLVNVDWVVHPLKQLRLRAFGRYYGLSNKTPVTEWRYITSDVPSTDAGAATYINRRRNLAYQYDKQNYGLEGDYSIAFWNTTFGLGYEWERFGRKYREANTTEHIVRASARTRPLKWLTARTKVSYGDRKAGHYEPEAGAYSYWYAPTEASDNIDSGFTFENHPDTRRWDVTDRKRKQVDLSFSASPADSLDVSLSGRWRDDNFDSNVAPSQPLLHYAGAAAGFTAADRVLFSPGDQVGLIRDTRNYVGVDVSYAATKRLRVNVFGGREQGDSFQRGFEFQENNKANPTAIAAATELGPWSRRSMQWIADTRELTYSYGAGASVDIIEEKLAFNTNLTHSIGKVDMDYDGFGVYSSVSGAPLPNNHEFSFRSPPVIRNDRIAVSSSLDYKVLRDLTLSLGYLFDYFRQSDWQQESNNAWRQENEPGLEESTRDSTAATSNQWGNRLPNMGVFLAPSYQAHVVSLAASYRF
ncbi:MAG: MtrB/PioB family outer membrane beta-barrel protein [Elusimicrobia bacterium]|nr:MtrB/PioB family outer membrane beta-barrel protein [Elusimicrobiota bacterium]